MLIDYIALSIYLLATLSQFVFWLFIFSRLAFYKKEKKEVFSKTKKPHKVSVIVCARNEEKNLKKNIPRILNQNYRSFELLVVNDESTDGTKNILLENHIESPTLRLLDIQDKPEGTGKKYALGKGIEASSHKVLLLTDADCSPVTKNWIDGMQQYIRGPIEIVLGYAPYFKQRGFLNLFIRFETVYTAIQYFSFALIGKPYMGVGRNLMYKKKLFFEGGKFTSHEHLLSGDDDLFINAAAHTHNTAICIDKQTFMYSEPEKTWANYFRQKSRHLTTGKHYKLTHQAILGTLSLGHILHILGGFYIIYKFSIIFVMLVYVARLLVVLLIMRPILKKLDDISLWKWIPILDVFFVIYLLVFAPLLLFRKHKQWK
ncbi:MAG: glycosyltransferase [Saprospiraceae bacterium]